MIFPAPNDKILGHQLNFFLKIYFYTVVNFPKTVISSSDSFCFINFNAAKTLIPNSA